MAVGPIHRIVEWDYRDQPDFGLVMESMLEVFNGGTCPSLVMVEDTGSDQYALVVCSSPITKADAQHIFDHDGEGDDRWR